MLKVRDWDPRGLEIAENGHFLIDDFLCFRGKLGLDDKIFDGFPMGELNGSKDTL